MLEPRHVRKRILVVDDDRAICALLEGLLQHDYDVACAQSGPEAIDLAEHFTPDAILLDIDMPGMDGHQLCRHFRSGHFDRDLRIIMVTAHTGVQDYLDAFKSGADAYIAKPINHEELRAKVDRYLRLQDTRIEIAADDKTIQSYGSAFERRVAARAVELLAGGDLTLCSLEMLANSVEPDDGERLARMRFYTPLVAAELHRHARYCEQIDVRTIRDLYRSVSLHDLGKIGIRREILTKNTPLTAAESEQMRLHTTIGGVLLEQAARNTRNSDYLAVAAVLARSHHEHFDGTGYPLGLAGEDIPLTARVITVVDAYDSLTSSRPDRGSRSPEEAKDLIARESGRHFDPDVVAAFEACFDNIVGVQNQLDTSLIAGALSFLE